MLWRLFPLYYYQMQWSGEAEPARNQAKEQAKERDDAIKEKRAAEKTSTTSSSSNGGSKEGKDRWWPWFRSDCSFCKKEVEELIEEEQQQQQQQQEQQSSSSASAAAAGPAYYPWQETTQQQQQEQSEEGTEGAAAADGGGENRDPPLHDSCYGAWPVPWDCPFKFRRLMWRLMGRVKPMALQFLAEQFGMCAHCGDEQHWQALVSTWGSGLVGWFCWVGGFRVGVHIAGMSSTGRRW